MGLNSDADWQAIYTLLPFVPPRNLNVIDTDIADTLKMYPISTATAHTRARHIFNLWRKVHADATLETFLRVLLVNNRRDLVLLAEEAIRDKDHPSHSNNTQHLAIDWRETRDTLKASDKYFLVYGPGRYSPLPVLPAQTSQ